MRSLRVVVPARPARLGITLSRVAKEILGHELEPYQTMRLAGERKGAWAPHEARKDVATVIGRPLGLWDRACEMAMDKQETLKQKYHVPGYCPIGEVGEHPLAVSGGGIGLVG